MRAPSKERGFTLIELLIVVAIIGLLAAMLIPNMLDALQKAKQKKTVADCRLAGGAMMSWITDQASAAAAGASTAGNVVNVADYPALTQTELKAVLIPTYIAAIPELDGWKQSYEYHLNTGDPRSDKALLVRSKARDGVFDTDSYTFGAFEVTDYDRDIVWINGFFVRWPQKLS